VRLSLLSRKPPSRDSYDQSILEAYVASAPSAQNAVDVFSGQWSSRFPEPLAQLEAGPVPLFEDERVRWAIEQLGGIEGLRVLELGPLEGGHSYQLVNAGAEVVAIESHTRAYLRCLIAKELLGMTRAQFLLGDFMEYLRSTTDHYDVCFASGVLYHMRNPVETIALAAETADNLVLWTHVYDEEPVRANELVSAHFRERTTSTYEGFEHSLYRHDYNDSLELKGFCGGSAPHANWLSRQDLMAALDHFGWTVKDVAFDDPHHIHGPALALVATRTKQKD
jgi:hypothetical protein